MFKDVPTHWQEGTLGDLCARGGGNIQTGPFGSQLHASDYVQYGIPSIMPENLGANRINTEGIARISAEDAERLNRYRLQSGDIVYSRRGDVTKRGLAGKEHEGWLCGTGCLRVRFGDGQVRPPYAFYYLGHLLVKDWIVRHAIGATLPNLNTSIMAALPFLVPPPREQEAIAEILGALDDKIESNRRMNETLEAMARAIFKSWFVDFLPVRAKIAARTPTGDPVRLPARELAQAGAKAEGRLPAPRPNTYYVYVIECENGSHYIGQTDDLQRRWEDHKAGKVEWTKRHKPVKVAHFEEFPTRQEAVKRESVLKTGFGRKWLKKLILEGRARQAGQPSGMDASTALSACDLPACSAQACAQAAALFPDSFQDSPLGKIPKGWKVGKLSDICTSQYGYTASATQEAGGPKFLRVMDINKRNWIEWASVPYCLADDEDKAKYALAVGDIVVARMADPGKSAIVEEQIDAVFASYLVRLKTKTLSDAYYIYGFLKSEGYAEYSEGAMGGSVQANMNAKVIVAADLVIPPWRIIEAFFNSIFSLRRHIAANLRQSATLAAVRDALLPKLISGEIRVKDSTIGQAVENG